MLEIKLTKESVKLLEQLFQRFSTVRIYTALDKFFDQMALWVSGQIIKTALSGQVLSRRTGNLAKSITGRAFREKGVPGFKVGIFRGPALRYAGVLEYGTKGYNSKSPYPTIKPKKAKALAMPINDALTPAGVARFLSPRDFSRQKEELIFVPYQRGSGAIGGLYTSTELIKGETNFENAKASYLLLAKADIKPRWYLRNGLRRRLPTVVKKLGVFLTEILSGKRKI
jgi:hypothetical protein